MHYIPSLTFNDIVRRIQSIKLYSLMRNRWTMGILLATMLFFLVHRLRRSASSPSKKNVLKRVRKRDRFLHYGQKFLRSVRLYTFVLNRRKLMLKLAKNLLAQEARRKQLESIKSLMLKSPSLPRFLLECDSESVFSQSSTETWPPEIHYILKNVKVFGHFEKPVILNLCRFVYTQFVPAGTFLFRIGNLDDTMYVVRKGRMQVLLTENERCRYPIKTCSESDSIFSLLSIADYLGGIKRRYESVSCKALEDSTIIALPFNAFTTVFSEFPESLVRFSQIILLRFRRITFMTLHDHLGLTAQLMQTVSDSSEPIDLPMLPARSSSTTPSAGAVVPTPSADNAVSTHQPGWHEGESDFQAAVSNANVRYSIHSRRQSQMVQLSSDSDYSEYGECGTDLNSHLPATQAEIASKLGLQISVLEGRLSLHRVSKNTMLYVEGQSSEKIVYLVEGSMSATCKLKSKVNNEMSTTKRQSKEKQMFVVKAKEFVGILSVLTGESALYSVKTRERCIICVITKDDVYMLLREEPSLVLRLMQSELRRVSDFVRKVDFGLEWTFFEAGKAIYRQGKPADNVFIILNGRVRRIYAEPEKPKVKHLLGEHGRGETLGFIEVFMDMPRQSTVMAIRDTETTQISSGLLNYLKTAYPDVLANFMHMARQTLLSSVRPSLGNPDMKLGFDNFKADFLGKRNQNLSTVAVFPINEQVPIEQFTSALTAALQSYGSVIRLTKEDVLNKLGISALSSLNEHRLLAWLSQQEEVNRLVIYQCSSTFNRWSRRCVRQADCVLAVGIFWTSPDITEIELQVQEHSVRAQKELVLLHRIEDRKPPRGTANWLRDRTWCSSHHHIRCPGSFFLDCSMESPNSFSIYSGEGPLNDDCSEVECSAEQSMSDMHRLARFLMGRSVGLALGGGGAKGIAHIGILEAMMEQKIPVDLIGGTSMGSFVSGLFAVNLNMQYCVEQASKFSLEMKSLWKKLFDLTYPVVAMFTGSAFNNIIQNVFGDVQIEDLWIPYFCVTTDISESKMRVHTSGVLWRYIRASMSYSTILPPICDPLDSHLLLDGCYVNNVPADIIRRMGAYQVIAVDVGSRDESQFTNYGDSISGWWLLWKKLNPWGSQVKVPDMEEIQSRLAYVSCQRQLEFVKQMSRCEYIRPPIDRFGSLQFGSFQEIKEVGYTYGKAIFHNRPDIMQMDDSRDSAKDNLLQNQPSRSYLNVGMSDAIWMKCSSSDDDNVGLERVSIGSSSHLVDLAAAIRRDRIGGTDAMDIEQMTDSEDEAPCIACEEHSS